MKGFIHSIESFGTVDGPGIRCVLFLQGCPLRCLYCHNPDTWDPGIGKEVSVEEILSEYRKNLPFYQKGGITVTGGEPLLQIDFLIDLFQQAKKEKIHTCIDTSGITYDENPSAYRNKLDQLMQYCDLVLLDIKHIDAAQHKTLTGQDLSRVLAFAKYLEERKIPVWIRHTVVPGITDHPDDLIRLGEWIGKLKNLQAFEVLPYHTLGVTKYKELGIPYPLEGVLELSKEEASQARKWVLEGIRHTRDPQ